MTNYSAWNVSTRDFPSKAPIERQIAFLCRYATLAPSVHNVQPWRFEVAGSALRVYLATERTLEAGDPTGRESWLSIGAAIENLIVAAEYFGLNATETRRNAGSIEYEFLPGESRPELELLLNAAVRRASNREPYSLTPVAREALDEISGGRHDGIQVVASSDRKLIELVANLTGRAIAIALGNPSFRDELSSLVHSSWTKKSTGMPGFGLAVSGVRSLIENKLIRSGVLADAQGKKEHDVLIRSGAMVLVFSEGDTQPYWISAGRAYQHAALVATAHGLDTATMAATVEAADFHLDVERFCNASGRLQVVMRIGEAAKAARHSPRLNVEDVLTFSS